MASENEMLANIIAEYREMVHQSVDGIIAVKAYVIADRIEAALKRELESLLTKQGENVNSGSAVYTGENKGGNAAAMREALVKIREQLRLVSFRPEGASEEMGAIARLVWEALATKPRNCDLYDNVEDAWQAYKQFRERTGGAVCFNMVHFWPFANWLFALAAE